MRGRDKSDLVNHPPHYTRSGIECVDVIEALGLGYHLGTAMKYLWRAGYKDGSNEIVDLEKAVWFLLRYIEYKKKQLTGSGEER